MEVRIELYKSHNYRLNWQQFMSPSQQRVATQKNFSRTWQKHSFSQFHRSFVLKTFYLHYCKSCQLQLHKNLALNLDTDLRRHNKKHTQKTNTKNVLRWNYFHSYIKIVTNAHGNPIRNNTCNESSKTCTHDNTVLSRNWICFLWYFCFITAWQKLCTWIMYLSPFLQHTQFQEWLQFLLA